MNPTIISEQQHHILYDSDVISQIVPQWFEIEYWRDQAQIQVPKRGRGSAWFITSPDLAFVLRHYQRGGLIATLLQDRYFWRGLEGTRPWKEWQLLARLYEIGLPVPQPLAAHVIRSGPFYRADLITATIQDAQSLSELLVSQSLDEALWRAIGKVLKQFHAAHVYHSDMNAHNILINKDQKVYLIDFDKCKIMSNRKLNASWFEANLQRLQRSLNKLRDEENRFHYLDKDWRDLMEGYHSG
jgi:3-deoxy-D-manno-octulosonic acid kinase